MPSGLKASNPIRTVLARNGHVTYGQSAYGQCRNLYNIKQETLWPCAKSKSKAVGRGLLGAPTSKTACGHHRSAKSPESINPINDVKRGLLWARAVDYQII